MKKCPFCAEEIQDQAIKCKHCGSMLTDTAAQAPTESGTSSPPTGGADALDMAQTIVADAVAPGRLLAGRYRIDRRLGAGGMGEVWLARDAEMDDMAVAVKVLPAILSRNAQSVRALKHEAAIALRLTHPSICRLHHFESDGETKFLVMEYIEGQTLEAILADREDGKMPWSELAPIARQIGAALDYAHGQRSPVLHRDIKPGNIMVTPEGHAKLLDFGIAREMHDSITRLSGRQDTSGTLPYMSPEQFRGERLDARSDVYSLCTVLYEALAGVPLVSPGGSVAWQVQEKQFEAPPGMDPVANRLLSAGLSKDREKRPERIVPVLTGPAAPVHTARVAGPPKAPPPPEPPTVAPRKSPVASPPPPPPPSPPPVPRQASEAWRRDLDGEARHDQPMGGGYAACRVLGLLLPVLSVPITLAILAGKLRGHVARVLGRPAFGRPAMDSPEGGKIVTMFWKSRGMPAVLYGLLLAPVVLGAYVYLFAAPASAPSWVDYDRALEHMVACEPCSGSAEIRSQNELYRYAAYIDDATYDLVPMDYVPGGKSGSMRSPPRILPPRVRGSRGSLPELSLSRYRGSSTGSLYGGYAPYEGTFRDSQEYGREYYARLRRVYLRWRDSEDLGIVLYAVFLPLVLLTSGWFFARMRWRFARHRLAEVLAMACVSGDSAQHGRLIADVRRANRMLKIRTVLLAVTGLHLLVSPFTTPMLYGGHLRWHARSGLDQALGGA